jgi:Flp pilus assembly protein TadD
MAQTRREKLEAMLAESPGDAELQYFLAMEDIAAGASELAAERLVKIIRESPDYVPAYVQCGQALARLGRENEARTIFEQGIAAARRTGNEHAAGEMEGFLDAIR